MRGADDGRAFRFERFHFLPENESPRAEHAGEGLGEFLLKRVVLRVYIKKWDWHWLMDGWFEDQDVRKPWRRMSLSASARAMPTTWSML